MKIISKITILKERNSIVCQIFTRFLKERNIYYSFIKNEMQHKISRTSNIKSEISPINMVACAFFWDETEEGTKFWSEMSEEWIEYYNDKKSKVSNK